MEGTERELIREQLYHEQERHQRTLQYYQERRDEELLRHQRVQKELEEQLIALQTGDTTDDPYWLNNQGPVLTERQEREAKERKQRKLTDKEKKNIRNRVKKWAKKQLERARQKQNDDELE